MIFFDDVTKKYGKNGKDFTAVENVSLTVSPKEFVSIVGHSGAGKTTLLKMILGEDNPSEGNIYFESINIHNLKHSQINDYRRRIGTVFQDFRLLSHLNAYENIAFAMEAAGRTDEEIAADVPHVLELVDLKKKMHKQKPQFMKLTFG